MIELLLPRTDAGVAVQAVIAFVVLVAANIGVARRPSEVRLFVAGITVLVVAGFGLRALH